MRPGYVQYKNVIIRKQAISILRLHRMNVPLKYLQQSGVQCVSSGHLNQCKSLFKKKTEKTMESLI